MPTKNKSKNKSKNKLILLTRSEQENAKAKITLDGNWYEIIDCPLLSYDLIGVDLDFINKFDGIVITSKFAAINMPNAAKKSVKLWVVGDNSAEILASKGYEIVCCGSNAADLKENLANYKNLNLLYLCGNYISTPMPKFVYSQVFYQVNYLQQLTDQQIQQIKCRPNYILLYSVNCAKTLLQLINNYNLQKFLEQATIIALSYKIGSVFDGYCDKIVVKNSDEAIMDYLKVKLYDSEDK